MDCIKWEVLFEHLLSFKEQERDDVDWYIHFVHCVQSGLEAVRKHIQAHPVVVF